MLLVDGEPVPCSSPEGSSGRELVAALMGNPGLRAASERLRAAPERRVPSGPEGPRHVYVFQREYATVDPARVELVGTDEMTTCVGVAIRNNKTGISEMPDWAEMASSLNQLSDSEVLLQCSTSPAAEPSHFVETERRIWKYLIENPDWEDAFPKYKPRVFHWSNDGGWSRHS